MNWVECGTLFLSALVSTAVFVPLAKRIALRCKAIDYPSSRRINTRPVPRLGGIAMFAGLVVALAVLLVGIRFWGWQSPFTPHPNLSVNYVGVAVGVAVMFAVGVADDVKDLRPKLKLAGQIVSACIVAGSGLLLSSIYNPFGGSFIEFGWLSYPITVFYLVAFANIINLIDGLDGLAAGIAAITGITIFSFAVLTNRPDATFLSVAIVGVCIGFLLYNFHPASIFMGDSGSLLLGFSLGVVSLFAVARSALFVSLLVPILAAGVPIIDTALAIMRRKRSHRPIDEADKGHIHHQLMKAGFSHQATVMIMWGWTAILALCAVLITEIHGFARIPILCVIIGVTAFAIVKLDLLEPVLRHHYNPREQNPESKEGKEQGPDGE